MKRFIMSKYLFFVILIAGVLGLTFAFGLYSGVRQTVVYEAVRTLKNSIEKMFDSEEDRIAVARKNSSGLLGQIRSFWGSSFHWPDGKIAAVSLIPLMMQNQVR